MAAVAHRTGIEGQRGSEHETPRDERPVGIPNAFPIAPIPGPPATCPIASDWPEREITVARTDKSSIDWLSHVM